MIIDTSAATARAKYGSGGEGVYLDVPAIETTVKKKRIGKGDANKVSLVRSRGNSVNGGPAAKTRSEWEYKRYLDKRIVKRATDGEESGRGCCMCVVSEEGVCW
jgi:hypothetical protein